MTIVRRTNRQRAAMKRVREKGYDDGYAGRPAHMAILEYQRAYILGVNARNAEREQEDDDAA